MEAEHPPQQGRVGRPGYLVGLLALLLVAAGLNVAEFGAIEQRAGHQYQATHAHPDADLRVLSWETTATIRERFAVYALLGHVAQDRQVVVRDDMDFRTYNFVAFSRAADVRIADYDAEVDREVMRALRQAATWRGHGRQVGDWAIVEPDGDGPADVVAVTYRDLVALVPAEVAAEHGVHP